MGTVVKGMEHAMASMNLEEVSIYLTLRHYLPFPSRLVYVVVSVSYLFSSQHRHRFIQLFFDFTKFYVQCGIAAVCIFIIRTYSLGKQISNIMDQFESQFEQLDVRTGVLEQGMHTATMTTAPEDQIDALLQEVTLY